MFRIPQQWLVAVLIVVAVVCSSVAQEQPPLGSFAFYHPVENWLRLPAGQPLGTISWVDVDAQGSVYVLRRCGACGQHPQQGDPPSVVWKFDRKGNFLGEWGKVPIAKEGHSLRVDRNGFIWITDTGAHQVKKFRPDGTLVMTLGKYGVPGDGPDVFNMPTDTFVTQNGDFFVTDGYGNHRVMKFNKDGELVKTFGSKGSGPGEFRIPHSIVQDSHGRLIVVDRCGLHETGCTDNRIEVFDTDGNFLDQWSHMGGVSLYITGGDTLYVGVIGKIFIADALTGKVRGVIEKAGINHGIAVDNQGDVYAADIFDGMHRFTRDAAR
ncbi:MAG: peptidyl-alpha-hydroxyglycine alpha-amidating lyase family protein [Candidatus Acidiferrales bacterium]|jgi:DNA-binding beta-propeller fold protein YncE